MAKAIWLIETFHLKARRGLRSLLTHTKHLAKIKNWNSKRNSNFVCWKSLLLVDPSLFFMESCAYRLVIVQDPLPTCWPLSWLTKGYPPQTDPPPPGWPLLPGITLSCEGDYVMDGRGRSALTLTKRILFDAWITRVISTTCAESIQLTSWRSTKRGRRSLLRHSWPMAFCKKEKCAFSVSNPKPKPPRDFHCGNEAAIKRRDSFSFTVTSRNWRKYGSAGYLRCLGCFGCEIATWHAV